MNSPESLTGKTRLRILEYKERLMMVLEVQTTTFDYGRQEYKWRDATIEDLSIYGYTPAALNIPTL